MISSSRSARSELDSRWRARLETIPKLTEDERIPKWRAPVPGKSPRMVIKTHYVK